MWLVASCQARPLKPKLYERVCRAPERAAFFFSWESAFLFSCESEPSVEGKFLSPASIPWTFLRPPLFTITCFVISNLHSTGGGILSLGSGASCPRATTCNSVSVSCYGPPRVRSSALHRDAPVGIRTFARLSVLAARRQTPTLTGRGQGRSGRKQPHLLMVSCRA